MKTAVLFVAAILNASTAAAQNQPLEVDSCVRAIHVSSLKRIPVFLEATADPTTDPGARDFLVQADFFAQAVASRTRDRLGGNESKLPQADSAVAWSMMWGEVRIVVHRNAPLTWHVSEWVTGADTAARSPLRLILSAVAEVTANGETVIFPERLRGDSVSFGLSLVTPVVSEDGKIVPAKARQPFPIFSIATAWSKPVAITRSPNIAYPEVSRGMMTIGNVKLAFAVDKSGRADPKSMKELWPEGVERPTGELRDAYQAFVRAVMHGLQSARFSPAIIGGCVVKQTVYQTFEFRFP